MLNPPLYHQADTHGSTFNLVSNESVKLTDGFCPLTSAGSTVSLTQCRWASAWCRAEDWWGRRTACSDGRSSHLLKKKKEKTMNICSVSLTSASISRRPAPTEPLSTSVAGMKETLTINVLTRPCFFFLSLLRFVILNQWFSDLLCSVPFYWKDTIIKKKI